MTIFFDLLEDELDSLTTQLQQQVDAVENAIIRAKEHMTKFRQNNLMGEEFVQYDQLF